MWSHFQNPTVPGAPISCVDELAAITPPTEPAITAQRALANAMRVARAGAPPNAIGAAVEETVARRRHAVCTDLLGHGIGRRVHEPPKNVPNYYVPHLAQPLTDGLVLTIEPVISAGGGAVREGTDGWTLLTADGATSAHVEHTVVITHGNPIVLTA